MIRLDDARLNSVGAAAAGAVAVAAEPHPMALGNTNRDLSPSAGIDDRKFSLDAKALLHH